MTNNADNYAQALIGPITSAGKEISQGSMNADNVKNFHGGKPMVATLPLYQTSEPLVQVTFVDIKCPDKSDFASGTAKASNIVSTALRAEKSGIAYNVEKLLGPAESSKKTGIKLEGEVTITDILDGGPTGFPNKVAQQCDKNYKAGR